MNRLLSKRAYRPVSSEEGRQLATQIGALAYVECSAATGENVDCVLEELGKLI